MSGPLLNLASPDSHKCAASAAKRVTTPTSKTALPATSSTWKIGTFHSSAELFCAPSHNCLSRRGLLTKRPLHAQGLRGRSRQTAAVTSYLAGLAVAVGVGLAARDPDAFA